MSNTQHHNFGPSTLDRLAACSHYQRGEGGPAAERGSLIHSVAAGEIAPDAAGLDDEELAMLEFWHESVRGESEGQREVRLFLVDDDFNEVLFGTADFVRKREGGVEVYDLKSGQPHAYRYQMMAYAAAAMQTYGVDCAWVALVYARHKQIERMEFRDVRALTAQILRVIHEAKTCEGRPFVTGQQCDWCGGKLACPALVETATAVIKGYEPDMLPAEWHSSQICDPVEMAKALTVARVVATWAKSVEEHAKSMAMTGGDLPGYELKERRGNAYIADAQTAFNLLGFKPADFLSCVNVGVGKLAKLLAKCEGCGEAAAKKRLEDRLGPVLCRGEMVKFLQRKKEA